MSDVLRYKQRHPHVFKHRVAYYIAVVVTVSLVLQIVWKR